MGAFQAELGRRALGAALITSPHNVRFLTGYYTRSFNPFTVAVIPAAGAPVLITLRQDESLAVATSRVIVAPHELRPEGFQVTAAACRSALQEAGISRGVVGLEFNSVTVDRLRILEDALAPCTFTDVSALAGELRMIKDAEEQDALRHAGTLAALAMERAAAMLQPGVCEADVESMLYREADMEGARRWPDAVVQISANALTGPKVGRLHDHATGRQMAAGEPVFILASVSWNDYCGGDIARTFFLPGPSFSSEAEAACEVAREAQREAIAALRVDVPLGDAARAGRNVVARSGLSEKLTYRMFRGLGLTNIERPTALELDLVLRPGMCVCVQVYLQVDGLIVGQTDSVLVTETGPELLTGEFHRQDPWRPSP
jgi:Xaa-Pro aminopeptidase